MEDGKFHLPADKVKNTNGNNIIDYNESDFRDYWKENSKEILNKLENNLLKKWQKRLPEKGWFFDIGCGFGRNLPSYFLDSRDIVLVDYAMNHLKMARKKFGKFKNVYYIAADAYSLPFKNSVFNAGISIRLLHHIEKPSIFLNELKRILDYNSCCIVTYINKRSFFRILRYGNECLIRNHSQLSKMIYGTHPKYFKQLVKESGFRISDMLGSGFIHQLTHAFKPVNRFVNHAKPGNIFYKILENIFSIIFGKLSLSLVQFAFLKTVFIENEKKLKDKSDYKLIEILTCPICLNENLYQDYNRIICNKCGRVYPIINGIIDFTHLQNEDL